MENTRLLKESVGQGAVGQGSGQSGPVKFEACVQHPGVLWAAGFPSLQLRVVLWAGGRFLNCSSVDNDRSQSQEETEGEEAYTSSRMPTAARGLEGEEGWAQGTGWGKPLPAPRRVSQRTLQERGAV